MSTLRRKWRRWARALDTLILDEIRTDKLVFDEYRRIVNANPRIQQPAVFHHWVLGNYGLNLALQVRRLADADSKTYSIRRLIGSMYQHHKLVTRQAYLRSYVRNTLTFAERSWAEYAGSSTATVLPRGVYDADLRTLAKLSARAITLVDRDIAHCDRRRRNRQMHYAEIFAVLEAQSALLAKYADLVGYRMPGTILNGAYGPDWVRHFEEPWIVVPKE